MMMQCSLCDRCCVFRPTPIRDQEEQAGQGLGKMINAC